MKFQNSAIQELKIIGLNATVLFKISKDKFIDIQCDNSDVQIKEVNQSIIISDKDTVISSSGNIRKNSINIYSNNGRVVINSNNINNCIMVGNNIIMNKNIDAKSKKMPKTTLTIQAPFDQIRHLDLAIVGICCMDGISKRLIIDASISTSLDISNINKVSLSSSGNVHALLKNIKNLKLDTSGQSYIDIQNIEELTIDASGQSEIDVKSDTIMEAEVDVSGMGSIQIETQTIESLEADLSGMSMLNVFENVLKKHIDASGMSHCKIG